ncbi:MAG: chemotaxis protein CheW [Alphaproteobacteria bacterium]|jgi:purine-binding chemotaxis protein CheW|nr:chemotaxis protein CheW [Alphaproteobacteria bacterium]MBP9876825.1 chemotaxis protein CheW [Alphaproteobacteria bacterium]
MTNHRLLQTSYDDESAIHRSSEVFVTLKIDNQLFGIPILQVQDVLSEQKITKIPLAPKEIAGALNLRGRIVTAIDVRTRLNLPKREAGENKKSMSVVIDYNGELYSLIVDTVGEVLNLYEDDHEKNPSTLDPVWASVAHSVYRLNDQLLVVLDVRKMLNLDKASQIE